MNSPRTTLKLPSMSTLLVTSGITTATFAVAVGFSNSMALSAVRLGPLPGHSTWQKALATIFIVTATLKVTATTFTRERCEWDSGSENVPLSTSLQTLIQAGEHRPGSSSKKWQKPNSKHDTHDQQDSAKVFKIINKSVET